MDISPKLLESILKDFERRRAESQGLKGLLEKLKKKTATYKDADSYAVAVGDMLAKSYAENLSADILPNGKMYYNIANSVIRPTLELDHNIIVDYTAKVQKLLNEGAGLGLNAVVPEVDQNRIQGIIDRLAVAEDYDTISWILGEPVRNFSQNVVDESARLNFEYQSNTGLSPKIIRTAEAPGIRSVKRGNKTYKYQVPCKWCAALAGTYDYKSVQRTGSDVYRRHEGCRCTVEYSPDGVKRQNVWDKTWIDDTVLKMRQTIGLNNTELENNINDLKAIGFSNPDTSLRRVDPKLLKDTITQLSKLEQTYNIVSQVNPTILYNGRKKALAYVSRRGSTSIELGLCKDYKSRVGLIDIIKDNIAIGHFMPIDQTDYNLAVYTVTHEYGHIIQNYLYTHSPLAYGISFDNFVDVVYNTIINKAQAIDPSFSYANEISIYGTQNHREFFAECFANSQLGAPNTLGLAMLEYLRQEGLI